MVTQTNTQTILIVGERQGILGETAAWLRREGFGVLIAEDRAAAILSLMAHQPDLVLLDTGDLAADGLDTVSLVRGYTEVPVIVRSASASASDCLEAIMHGADDYVPWPVGRTELLARIRAKLRRGGHFSGTLPGIS